MKFIEIHSDGLFYLPEDYWIEEHKLEEYYINKFKADLENKHLKK